MSEPIPKIGPYEHIMCAYAEPAHHGPGWINAPIWLIIRGGNGKIRQDCIQPEHRTAALLALYGVSAAVHASMLKEVKAIIKPTKKSRGEA